MTQTGYDYDGAAYYRARYYDPSIGRFISEDPIGFDGDGTNFYAYVRNDPANSIDPWGWKLCRTTLPGLGNVYMDDQLFPLVERWIYLNQMTGIDAVFTEAFRTTAYQAGLQSNSNAITPAKAGSSLHEAGFAVDISWRRLSAEQQAEVVLNAETAGLSWGGYFGKKPDRVHFYHDPGNRRSRISKAQQDYKGASKCNDQCSK
jgi:RHS repeat-associated protein